MQEDNMTNEKSKFDVKKRQESAFDALRRNVDVANEISKYTQNWLLIIGIAELSFLGTFLVKGQDVTVIILIFIKILLTLLLFAFVVFFLGSFHQRKHIMEFAKKYQKVSDEATRYIKSGKNELSDEPKDLELPRQQAVSSSAANDYFKIAIYSLFIVTVGIIFLIAII